MRVCRQIRRWPKKALILVFCCVLTALTLIPPAQATPPAAPAAAGGATANVVSRCNAIRNDIKSNDVDKVYLTEAIVECIKITVFEAFETLAEGFYPLVSFAIKMTLTLAVVLFGVMLATGMIEKSARDGFILLLKLSCVLYFVQVPQVLWMFHSGMDAMDSATDIVFQFGKGTNTGRCNDNETVWDRVDCMLDVIVGIKKDASASGETTGISRGLLHFFFSNMASSGIGAVIGMIGLYVMYSFLFAVLKSIHTYLAAILAIAFVLILAPLFIPLILFKQTRQFFDKWYRIIIAYILQPVILFGFLSLMMLAFDSMLVSGSNSLLGTATGSLCTGKVISECYEENGLFTSNAISQFNDVSDPARYAKGMGARTKGAMQLPSRPLVAGGGPPQEAVQNLYATSRKFESIDYARLAQLMGESGADKIQEKLVLATITLAMASFIFLSVLNYIPTLAQDLSGGVYEVSNLYDQVGKNLPGAEQAEIMARNFSHQIRGTAGSLLDGTNPSFNQLRDQLSSMITRRGN